MPNALSLSRTELPEEIATAIEAYGSAEADYGNLSLTGRKCMRAAGKIGETREALTAAILSRLGEAESRREEAAKERDLLLYRVCETHTAGARALRDVEKRVNAALDEACRMSAILLMAGEMTAQERRTAQAVANGLAAKVRSALSEAPPQGEQ